MSSIADLKFEEEEGEEEEATKREAETKAKLVNTEEAPKVTIKVEAAEIVEADPTPILDGSVVGLKK